MEKTRTLKDLQTENEELKVQLEEAEEALRAIHDNEVDALVVSGAEGPQVFTLQGADQPYRVFIECMNEGAVTMSPDGTILHCNSQFADMLGKPLNTIIGASFFDLLVEKDASGLQGLVRSCDMEGFKGKFVIGTDGNGVPIQLSARPLNKEMDTFCVVITDLTELEREHARLYAVLEALPVMVLLLTPNHSVSYANRAFKNKFGEPQGRKCFDYLFDKKEPCDFCEAFRVLETGMPHHWECRLADGGVVDVYNSPFTDADGTPLVLEVDIDITQQRQMEGQLRQAQKMEALGTLTGGIAHDFNNILAAILGFAEMSLDDVPQESLLERNLRNILKSSLRARDLIKQMLTFSRKSEYEIKPMPLMPLIKETMKLLRASIPTTVKIYVDTSVTSDIVEANATGIQQILMNLATNAAYAMRDTGGKLKISLSDAEIGSGPDYAGLLPGVYVKLTVSDTGTGMDEIVQKRIFEPFFTTKGPGEGTGMGLSVVYGIVKNLKGEITVESAPGKGSTFHVLIPKVTAGEEAADSTAEEALGRAERVLFIDDEDVLVELGEAMLEKLGYRVIALTDSLEALKVFSEDPSAFDLIITDQTMPGLTGVRLAKEMLKIRPELPIILCTGFSESINIETVKAAGIRDLLMKPLARKELGEAVRRTLDAKSEA